MTFTAQIFMKITITERSFVKAFCAEFYTNQTKNTKERDRKILQMLPQQSRSPQMISPIMLRSLTTNFVQTVQKVWEI
jgi:septum formation topological specificity factor MinE